MTQKEEVLQYLKENGSITTAECFSELFVLDLQSSIRRLKQDGHNILSKWIYTKNKYGRPVRYKKYKLASSFPILDHFLGYY